jgi:hypothetical protein
MRLHVFEDGKLDDVKYNIPHDYLIIELKLTFNKDKQDEREYVFQIDIYEIQRLHKTIEELLKQWRGEKKEAEQC